MQIRAIQPKLNGVATEIQYQRQEQSLTVLTQVLCSHRDIPFLKRYLLTPQMKVIAKMLPSGKKKVVK